jgi:hypothetical protein
VVSPSIRSPPRYAKRSTGLPRIAQIEGKKELRSSQ